MLYGKPYRRKVRRRFDDALDIFVREVLRSYADMEFDRAERKGLLCAEPFELC